MLKYWKVITGRGNKEVALLKRLLIVIVLACLMMSSLPLSGCATQPVKHGEGVSEVTLDSGTARGTVQDGVQVFLGIPYAAPPVGELRWKEPQPVKPWKGVRDCNKFSLACPQPATRLYDIGQTSEDCLYLNVWSPARSDDEALPVMVWIHGGGFTTGTASFKMYDGMNLARQGVIIVTINYRLGPLGFLSHPLLSKESAHGVSGNYGLLDQIAALKWVKSNIKAFGGNPDLVTIFGESAGAGSVIDLMISPLADGLFQRAISESGSFSDAYPINRDDTVAKAEITGEALAKKLGADKSPDALTAMRLIPADDVVKAAFDGYEALGSTRYRPVVDGWVIPADPWSMYSAGKQKKVPLLIGTQADEGTIFILTNLLVQAMTVQDYEGYITTIYKDNAAEALSLFPAAAKGDVPGVYAKLFGIMSFGAGLLHAADSSSANGSPVYVYRFTHVPDFFLKMFGAFHGLDIFYVFGNLRADKVSIPDSEVDTALSQDMMKYWTNFARTGDPNGTGLTQWPAYTAAGGQYMEFGDQLTVRSGMYKEYRGLMDRVTAGK